MVVTLVDLFWGIKPTHLTVCTLIWYIIHLGERQPCSQISPFFHLFAFIILTFMSYCDHKWHKWNIETRESGNEVVWKHDML